MLVAVDLYRAESKQQLVWLESEKTQLNFIKAQVRHWLTLLIVMEYKAEKALLKIRTSVLVLKSVTTLALSGSQL